MWAARPAAERRALLACTFSSVKYPGRAPDGYALLRCFVGGAMNEADLQARGAVKLLAPIAAGRIRDAVATNLRKLKRLLETE